MSKPSSSKAQVSKANLRHVNNLLNTLRGEHFRHAQNIRGSQEHISRATSYHTPTKHTLPISRDSPPRVVRELSSRERDVKVHEPAWRAEALSLLFKSLAEESTSDKNDQDRSLESFTEEPKIPLLTQLCLRVLLECCPGPEFEEDLVPCLPSHLRQVLLRWTAVHSPLSTARLYSLCEPDGHIDGELIVVGPQASLRSDYFKPKSKDKERINAHSEADEDSRNPSDDSWDTPSSSSDSSSPLTTLALLTTSVLTTTLLIFPPTLTHLALLALTSPTPVHRLPGICPLLEVLDLSFNMWLSYAQVANARGVIGGGESMLDRMEWRRWSRLRVLGLRECGVGRDIVRKVNRGRWTDVEVVGMERTTNPKLFLKSD